MLDRTRTTAAEINLQETDYPVVRKAQGTDNPLANKVKTHCGGGVACGTRVFSVRGCA